VRRVSVIVTGKVQGVCYRYFAKKEANRLDIKGWCQNRENDKVYLVAEGKEKDVDKFIEWAKNGSTFAKVINTKISEEKFEGLEDRFEVR